MNISKKLKELRIKSGLSQEKVAEQLYVSRQAISKWENGETLPDMENLIAISKFYNVSVDYILSEDEDEKIAEPPVTGLSDQSNEVLKISPKICIWRKWYAAARCTITAVTVITIINYIFELCNIFNFSIPFGAVMPSNLLFYGMTYSGRNHKFNEILGSTGGYVNEIPDVLFYLILIFTSAIIIGYVISVVFSGKNRVGFLFISLILYGGDCLYYIGTNVIANIVFKLMGSSTFSPNLMYYLNLVVKIAVLAVLIIGISSSVKIKRAENTKSHT